MTPLRTSKLAAWLSEPLPREVAHTLAQLAEAPDVERIAVMPDVHLAGPFCVGTVLATTERIYPQGVGSDIGCGMSALRFEGEGDLLSDETAAREILARFSRQIPTNKHRPDEVVDELPLGLDQEPLSDPALERVRRREGRYQLGTLGRGNHFVELQADQEQALWLMVHSGSRGMGQAISEHHRRRAEADAEFGAHAPSSGRSRSRKRVPNTWQMPPGESGTPRRTGWRSAAASNRSCDRRSASRRSGRRSSMRTTTTSAARSMTGFRSGSTAKEPFRRRRGSEE